MSSGKKQDDNDFDQYFIDDKRVDKETWMKHNRDYQRTLPAILQRLGIQRDREREKLAKEFLALELAAKLGSAFRSFPSTAAVSDTLVTSGSQSLSQYNVPQDAITRIAQEQAKQVVEKNIVPLIEETARTTVQEHEKQERARENTPGERLKRYSYEIFWIIVGILITALFSLMLRALGMQSLF